MKILYTTPVLEYPAAGGPQISVETCIKALSQISELHIISRVSLDNIGGIKAQNYFDDYCSKLLYSPSASIFRNRYFRKIWEVWNNRIRKIWDKYSDPDVNFIIEYFDKHSMDIIWCDRALERSFNLIYKLKSKYFRICEYSV